MRRGIRIVCLLAVLGGGLFAQGARPPIDGSAQDALLVEVRTLRTEIHQAASVSIRTQLLVARLQLQEQRVLTAARQLADAQETLAAVRVRIAGERERVRQLEDAASRATGEGRQALQQATLEAGTNVEQQLAEERQLQIRERELLKSVGDAQARWSNFSERLDALERSLTDGAPR